MKQTAVEFLFEKLWNTDKDKLTWYAILDQAKAMEKKQIINALIRPLEIQATKQAEQYYKETFKL